MVEIGDIVVVIVVHVVIVEIVVSVAVGTDSGDWGVGF